jgi:hypothetical protein
MIGFDIEFMKRQLGLQNNEDFKLFSDKFKVVYSDGRVNTKESLKNY